MSRQEHLAGGFVTRRALIAQPPIDWLAGWRLASGLKKGQSEVLIGRHKTRRFNYLSISFSLCCLVFILKFESSAALSVSTAMLATVAY